MADYNNIVKGLKLTTQIPLDVKTYVADEATLEYLGTSDNLAYTYYDGLRVFCIAERTNYEWREVQAGEENTGLVPLDFTYPDGLIAFGIDYSNKVYNFFPFTFTGPAGTNGTNGTNGVFGGNSVTSIASSISSNPLEGSSFIAVSTARHSFRASDPFDYTTIYQVGFNNVNIVGEDLSSWIDTFSLSNSNTKGYLRFFNATDSEQFLILAIKNVIVQGTGPNTLTSFAVEYVTHNDNYPWMTNGNGVCSFTQNGDSSNNLQRNITVFGDSEYTLQSTDNNYTLIIETGGTNKVIGIPSTGLPEKFAVALIQKGAGDVTISPYSGVTVLTPITSANKIKGPNFFAYLEKEGTSNSYYLGGNIKA